MTYSLSASNDDWLFRFFKGGSIVGKLVLDTTDKDALKTEIDALGWTEFTE
jgi:hypothetical protein